MLLIASQGVGAKRKRNRRTRLDSFFYSPGFCDQLCRHSVVVTRASVVCNPLFPRNFRRLVLGCIDAAEFSDQIFFKFVWNGESFLKITWETGTHEMKNTMWCQYPRWTTEFRSCWKKNISTSTYSNNQPALFKAKRENIIIDKNTNSSFESISRWNWRSYCLWRTTKK